MYCEPSGGQGTQYDSPLSMPSWGAAHKIDFGSQFLADRHLSGSLEPAVKFFQYIFDGSFVGFWTEPAAAGFGIIGQRFLSCTLLGGGHPFRRHSEAAIPWPDIKLHSAVSIPGG
jgi:hypothetical protein